MFLKTHLLTNIGSLLLTSQGLLIFTVIFWISLIRGGFPSWWVYDIKNTTSAFYACPRRGWLLPPTPSTPSWCHHELHPTPALDAPPLGPSEGLSTLPLCLITLMSPWRHHFSNFYCRSSWIIFKGGRRGLIWHLYYYSVAPCCSAGTVSHSRFGLTRILSVSFSCIFCEKHPVFWSYPQLWFPTSLPHAYSKMPSMLMLKMRCFLLEL